MFTAPAHSEAISAIRQRVNFLHGVALNCLQRALAHEVISPAQREAAARKLATTDDIKEISKWLEAVKRYTLAVASGQRPPKADPQPEPEALPVAA